FLNAQARNDPAIFLNELDTFLGSLVVLQLVDGLAVQPDFAILQLRLHRPRDGAEGGALAGAVAAQERDHVAFSDVETDALNDVALAVVGVDIAHAEKGGWVGWLCVLRRPLHGYRHSCFPPR